MKAKLLKRLRKKGRNQIHIYSVTKMSSVVVGMSIGYDEDKYSGLFSFGDTEDEVKKKAEHVYIADYLKAQRSKKHD